MLGVAGWSWPKTAPLFAELTFVFSRVRFTPATNGMVVPLTPFCRNTMRTKLGVITPQQQQAQRPYHMERYDHRTA